MENKLCRICGRITDAYLHIFRTEGLAKKIETCLPIIVSPHCLLPETICVGCNDTVNGFYAFIKDCLQSIIILEAQLDVTDSCLKTKRRHEKSTSTDFDVRKIDDFNPYTDDGFDIHDVRRKIVDFERHLTRVEDDLSRTRKIVAYDSSSEDEEPTPPTRKPPFHSRLYFADRENDLINEIAERKSSLKRKGAEIGGAAPKIFKIDGSRRKKRPPVKVRYAAKVVEEPTWNFDTLEQIYDVMQERHREINSDGENNVPANNVVVERELASGAAVALPQVCLLCDSQFTGPSLLAAHVYETHGIDMAQIASSEPVPEKRKKIPNLVKITDLKHKRDSLETKTISENGEEPPTLEPTYVCPMCPASLTNKTDLFVHLRQKHPSKSHLICGLCLHMATSYLNLTDHMEQCIKAHPVANPFVCKVCKYSDDNQKTVENHITVHDFLINFCKKEGKIFDPADYIEMNLNCEATKTYTCNECGDATFVFFKEFSTHRRSLHSIFHCDLCNKFYGRNSHLWKHVNRLHKGHPSITCQFCYKTSASKYHLAQHFNKIHTVKSQKLKNGDVAEEEDFMNKKFEAFDFQSVRQSFMRQEMNMLGTKKLEDENLNASVEVPKEIDTSSNLYTNIITNYTPPANNGEFKCPKCSKGFHKKTLLKKHKKNCRPRLQKDLLTRCKSCSRIFKDRQSLAKHLVNYHSEYACELCDEKVQSKCEIVSHIRFSHPESHLFCNDCKNVLRNQEDLKTHADDHANSFVCQFCADLLPSKIKLKMHILSLHRKILSLSCGVCLKLFETQHILRDHVRLAHRDVLQPLTSCTVCGKNYGSKWKTYDHINKSHGRIFRACKACLEVFDTDADLEIHYEHMHSTIPKEKPIKKEVIIKKEVYESEGEREEKNSSTCEDSAPEEHDEPPPKLSLLEKRLTNPETIPKPPALGQQQPPKSPKKKSKKSSKSNSSSAMNDLEYNPDQNGANSSKRTVYVNSNDPSLCEICFKTWPAKKHLWQHYIRCHKQVAATVCGICLKTNANYEVLQDHLQSTHPSLLHGKGFGSNFICRICGRYHNASSKLRLHMAIHENFDWKLLERMKIKVENDDTQDDDDDINYESLIEQVECSSENENDSSSSSDTDDEDENGAEVKQEEESDVDESEIKREESDPDENKETDDDESNSSDEDDDDDECSISNNSENTNEGAVKNMNAYAQHPDVVDSAVKSICYEDDGCDQDYSNSDYDDVQTPNLNPHEIQSAVDSIL